MVSKVLVIFICQQCFLCLSLVVNQRSKDEPGPAIKTPGKNLTGTAHIGTKGTPTLLGTGTTLGTALHATGVMASHKRSYATKVRANQGRGWQEQDKSKAEDALDWLSFVGFMVFGSAVEIMVLKTWDRDVSVQVACLALLWWTVVSAIYCGFLKIDYSTEVVFTWIDGWLVEVMLSFDNLFVFVLIMDSFRIPSVARNRILMLSVLYCFGCRLAMFEAVAALKAASTIVTQVLGVFIAYCAYKVLMMDDDEDEDFENSPVTQWLSSVFPVTTQMDERGSFFIDNKASMSFISLLVLIIFDTVFAVDSVSAKSALIQSTYINFTSSGFAMIMLRAGYFLLDNMIDMFKYLKYGVGIILFIIAFMAIFPDLLPISNFQYCLILLAVLAISCCWSYIAPEQEEDAKSEKDQTSVASSRASRLSWKSKEGRESLMKAEKTQA